MSERYDYREVVKNDIKEYLDEHCEKGKRITDKERDSLYDDMFVSDSVTGNASGSYTFNSWEAEENVCHNLDLLGEAVEEFGGGDVLAEKMSGEWADVTIRCYLLGQLLDEVIEEWNDECEGEGKEEGDED